MMPARVSIVLCFVSTSLFAAPLGGGAGQVEAGAEHTPPDAPDAPAAPPQPEQTRDHADRLIRYREALARQQAEVARKQTEIAERYRLQMDVDLRDFFLRGSDTVHVPLEPTSNSMQIWGRTPAARMRVFICDEWGVIDEKIMDVDAQILAIADE